MILDDPPITYLTKKDMSRSKNGNNLVYCLGDIEIPIKIYAGTESATPEEAELSLEAVLVLLKMEASHIYQYSYKQIIGTSDNPKRYQASVLWGIVKTLTFDVK
jgi:hypothetical protein